MSDLLTKNEWMSESLIFLSKSLIRSFLDKKRAIRSEIKWANSQPCLELNPYPLAVLLGRQQNWTQILWPSTHLYSAVAADYKN